jgi:lipoprotein-releasing system permease protein
VRFREILRIALRYSLSFGRGHLSVFMASLSVLGLVLGTAVLLTVLSVMNGFDREMRERILALVLHITVHTLPDPAAAQVQAERLAALPGLTGMRRFVAFQGLLARGAQVTAVAGLGLEEFPEPLRRQLDLPRLDSLQGAFIGDSVAERLKVVPGDVLRVIVPAAKPGGAVETRRLPLAAVVDSGTELDEELLLLPLEIAASLAGLGDGISGLQLQVEDPFRIEGQLLALRGLLEPGNYATNWKMTHGNLYAAIRLSRELVVLLLASIVGVAAFNVVSALVLVVIDKRGAIAVLRTLGATRGEMALLFLLQGLLIGVAGATLGCGLGALLCQLLPGVVALLEQLSGARFLATDVYPVSFVPVDLRARDALVIAATAIAMCVVAALYPALRAAQLQPARVLHQDT